MLVDCHTHIFRKEHWSEELERESVLMRGGPIDLDIPNDMHFAAMAPVDKAIILSVRFKHVGMMVPNDVVADYVAEHPEKLIGFACVDPNEPCYLDEMHRVFEDRRMSGLKLGPVYQNYHPCDERMKPVYAYCEKNGIPVLFHQGATYPRVAPLKYSFPIQLEDIAMEHPDLVMVIAHMGHPWIEDTVVLIRKQPNMYADISALYYRPWQFYNGLMIAQEYGAAHKLLFGTDFPVTTPADTVAALKNVNHITGTSGLPRITDKTIYGILERDTLRLLNLS
jgi:predicted TIM-barrel fold metal-dependent hydrolase